VVSLAAKKYAVSRFQIASAAMIWGAISKKKSVFRWVLSRGVKINAKYYTKRRFWRNICYRQPESSIEKTIPARRSFIPYSSHTAKIVQKWCEENWPDFIAKG
jgi:hypothetical protein